MLDNIVHGATPFAPLLFANLVLLSLIAPGNFVITAGIDHRLHRLLRETKP